MHYLQGKGNDSFDFHFMEIFLSVQHTPHNKYIIPFFSERILSTTVFVSCTVLGADSTHWFPVCCGKSD